MPTTPNLTEEEKDSVVTLRKDGPTGIGEQDGGDTDDHSEEC
jgi:hypothetical protein